MDIIAPSITQKVINDSAVLTNTDNALVTIPRIQTGYLTQFTASNPSASAANLMIEDEYTPDSSNGNPSPTLVTKNCFPVVVPPAVGGVNGYIVIDYGHPLSKHMGSLAILSDTANVIVSYLLKLE
jgi:hypothetical protein